MPYFNIEDLIGWYDSDANHFLCDECFSKNENVEEKDYKPVNADELDGDHLFICDECGERFR